MMATATVPHFLNSFQSQIDDLLMRICTEMQLDDARHKLAEGSYLAVAKWLESRPYIARFTPAMYPQGSMRLGTTVKPLAGDEFDLDFVCEFDCGPDHFQNPLHALDLIEHALKSSPLYRPMVERKNRCIRLNHQHRFHLDVLPACKDPRKQDGCILVPDRELEQWTASNPKGYASWFESRSRRLTRDRLLERAQPIPPKQDAVEKPPLKLSVQLLKRNRDVRYKQSPDLAPISIVITTLAAHIYQGEQSVAVAMGNILRGMGELAQTRQPRIVVLNPTNRDEDLSERWDSDKRAYSSFVGYVTEFQAHWNSLLCARGLDKISQHLELLFGEHVAKQAIRKQAQDIDSARTQGDLGIQKGSGLLTLAGTSATRIRPSTFHGQET